MVLQKITEQKLKNKRYRATEKAIILAFSLMADRLSLRRLIRTARISRTTLYRHHGNITQIVPNYEAYILRKCKNTMRYFMQRKNSRLRTLYYRILIFLSANQIIVEFLLQCGKYDLIEKIVFALKPKILATGKITDGEMFNIYAKEVAAVIEGWCHAGFNLDAISATIDKVIYLTNTAHTRLGPLTAFDRPTPKSPLRASGIGKDSANKPRPDL